MFASTHQREEKKPVAMPTGKNQSGNRGYALLVAIVAVHLVVILMLVGRAHWKTIQQRDMEAELLFRGGQYVRAIENYRRQHINQSPPNLRILEKEKHIRRLFPDPLSDTGDWNLVIKPMTGGKKLLVVPLHVAGKFLTSGTIVGVCSTSPEPGFREYRGRKRYNEWAFYIDAKIQEEMPPLEYAGGA